MPGAPGDPVGHGDDRSHPDHRGRRDRRSRPAPRVRRRRHGVRPPGDVDLVRQPLRRGQHRADPRPRRSQWDRHRLHQGGRRRRDLESVSTPLVQALHRGGLDVCAWQFVYGDTPVAEAKVGAAAVARGADCLVIDAEGQYEGKYAAAERYIRALRARIGASFPVSLAGFPYVDYHPAFPYSVFFGPGGAKYNQPQMYWKAIGTSVRTVFEHTYLFNRLWGHPIYPLGQTYESPGRGAIVLFRSFAGATAGRRAGGTGRKPAPRLGRARHDHGCPCRGVPPRRLPASLRRGSRGDLVVWAQEHLRSAGQSGLAVTGVFGNPTRGGARIPERPRARADGVIGTSTWRALLGSAPRRYTGRDGRHILGPRRDVAAPRSRPPAAPPRSRQGLRDPCRPPPLTPPSGGDPGAQRAQGGGVDAISSPSRSQTRGSRAPPTPAGVPVETMSPGSSVISSRDGRGGGERRRSGRRWRRPASPPRSAAARTR